MRNIRVGSDLPYEVLNCQGGRIPTYIFKLAFLGAANMDEGLCSGLIVCVSVCARGGALAEMKQTAKMGGNKDRQPQCSNNGNVQFFLFANEIVSHYKAPQVHVHNWLACEQLCIEGGVIDTGAQLMPGGSPLGRRVLRLELGGNRSFHCGKKLPIGKSALIVCVPCGRCPRTAACK